ncbi:MFS transporter [Verrucomicrobia bacterium]|nr:MFS transporter [Verrucomicrobiota bacterium]MDC0218650.1 MFS transporter [Verrucomicrobiota bacterium]
MADSPYLTAPVKSKGMPKGIPYIIGNEAAERYSFYGMKAILVIFMTKYLMDNNGEVAPMSEGDAKVWYHLFNSAVYFTPLLGAIIADAFFGKYKTIIGLSLVYCAGHLALALDETRLGLTVGLTLIAIGAGGIKPCVSAHVGDQFGKTNGHLLSKIFAWFYFSINFGAFLSQIMTPVLLDRYGPHVAFGVPGGLMLLATIVFWMGREKFIHIPAGGMGFIKETFSKTGLKIIGRLCVIYIFVAMFWALFDQSSSAWVLQADKMDRNLLGLEWLPSQIGAINPVMIMTFIPIFTWLIYPALNRVFPLTPLRKIAIGFFVAVPSFLIPAWIETQIAGGELPNIIWQIAAYVVLTAAEVFISITALEFSYTQAPKKMKSLILGFFLMSVSIGNLFTAGVNHFIQNPSPSFKADVKGTYVLQLEVGDGETTETDTVTIEVGPEKIEPSLLRKLWDGLRNRTDGKKKSDSPKGEKETTKKPPTANAGNSRAVPPSQLVRLYGTAGKGDYNGVFTYAWKFVLQPEDANAITLHKADTRNAHFTPRTEGAYELEFVVRVGEAAEAVATNTVIILVTDGNLPPVVNIAEGGEVPINQRVMLNGADTSDPNGDSLTYRWSFVSVPEGSKLANANLKGPTFPGPTSKLTGANYYLFFAGMMLLAALIFIPVAMAYKPKEYLQDEAESGETEG